MIQPIGVFLPLGCMRKIQFIIILSVMSGISSCKSDDPENPECRDGSCEYTLHKDSEILITQLNDQNISASVNEGGLLVFEYRYTFEDKPNIADDEYTERLLFQVDADRDEFTIAGTDELEGALTLFRQYCFCFFEGDLYPENGVITGKKRNENEWEVTIDLAINTSFNTIAIKNTGIYRP